MTFGVKFGWIEKMSHVIIKFSLRAPRGPNFDEGASLKFNRFIIDTPTKITHILYSRGCPNSDLIGPAQHVSASTSNGQRPFDGLLHA